MLFEQRKSFDWAYPLGVAAIVVLMFGRTVFLGESVSRLDLLARWDSIFSGFKSGTIVGIDSSSILFLAPYNFFVARLWRQGELPVWNSLSELGCPLLADPESAVFSPFNWLLIADPTLTSYNLLLVLKLIILALGTYLFARRLRLGQWSCVFAAVTAGFCPLNQWYLELIGAGYCLTPLLFWAFTRLADNVSGVGDFSSSSNPQKVPLGQRLSSIATAAAVASLLLLTAHIEISFCAIMIASLWLVLVTAIGPNSQKSNGLNLVRHRLAICMLCLLGTGLITLCLAAPMLFPFLEYLSNSQSYKFASGSPTFVSPLALFLCLILPVYGGASAFLGVVALTCLAAYLLKFFSWTNNPLVAGRRLALGLDQSNPGLYERFRFPLLVVTAIVVSLTCKIPPLGWLYKFPPLCFVVTQYFLHIVVLFLAILAAFGFETLIARRLSLIKVMVVASMVAVAALSFRRLTRLFKIEPFSLSYDDTLVAFVFPRDEAHLCAALAIALVLLVMTLGRSGKWAKFLPPGLVLLGLASQNLIGQPALPVRPAFSYPKPEPIELVAASGERMVACGEHLFKPNTNLWYGIRDIRMLNALFPSRYLSFAKAAGAQITNIEVRFDLPLSRLLDLAAVKTVLTQCPAFDKESLAMEFPHNANLSLPVELGGKVRLSDAATRYLPGQRAVLGQLRFESDSDSSADRESASRTASVPEQFRVVLRDKDMNLVAVTDIRPIELPSRHATADLPSADRSANLPAALFFSLPVPQAKVPQERLTVALQIFDAAGKALAAPAGYINTSLLEFEVNAKDFGEPSLGYKLLSESNQSGVRLYMNERACPDAYVVQRVRVVKSADEALSTIGKADFKPWQEVVLEEGESGVATCMKSCQYLDAPKLAAPDSAAPKLPAPKLPAPKLAAAPDLAAPDTAGAVKSSGKEGDLNRLNYQSSRISRPRQSTVLAEVNLGRNGVLVLTDIHYPGWRAFVDGRECPVMHGNYLFRAVAVPAGRHLVRFEYWPDGLTVAFVLAFLGLASVSVLWLVPLVRGAHTDG